MFKTLTAAGKTGTNTHREEAATRIKPVYKDKEGSPSIVVEHEWSGSFRQIGRFTSFEERLEKLCGLPGREELPRILRAATENSLPAIWRRARLSRLEETAITIFSVLVFSSKKRWPQILKEFFEKEGWHVELGGRPKFDLRDERLQNVKRGQEIDKIIARLNPGYQLKLAKNRGYASGSEQVSARLEKQGFDKQQVKAIVEGRSLQDVACRYFFANQKVHGLTLKSVRNGYAEFKRLKKRFPAHFPLNL